ncbi:MAG TPA: PTS fructose transporter subunit IIA [Burkholderiaceae bacterium]|nr:PTS fructose transporter subunit IIA [Burkholderiaceae bacterium]
MIGVLIIAHQPLASALAAAASHVYSCAPERAGSQVRVLDVLPDADVPATIEQARKLIAEIDDGGGVLILSDVFGSTPGNVAARLAESGRVGVVAGVNLPMLLRALCYRDGTLADTVEKALSGGTQGVLQVAATPPLQNQSAVQRGRQGNDLARLHDQQ